VPVLALVGGVGSGKSSVAHWVEERRNVAVIDGDVVGHEVLQQNEILSKIREEFGLEVFNSEGKIDRQKLAKLVFGRHRSQQEAKTRLERIVHPEIKRRMEFLINRLKEDPDIEAVILDAAVLLEANWQEVCDKIVFVETSAETRLRRVSQNRNWTQEELFRREASQFSIEKKRELADYCIENGGSLSNAGEQLQRILDSEETFSPLGRVDRK